MSRMLNSPRASDRVYLRRLASYVLRNRSLLAMTIVTGAAGFVVTFIFPWLIGSLIDHVVAPRPGHNGTLPSLDERGRWLLVLAVISSLTAVAFGVIGWARGHFNVKLGNRIVTQIRADLFDHLHKLSLHFFSKERTGSIVWRLIHEVHGVNGLLYGGVILVFLDVIQFAVAFALLVAISPSLTLAVLCVMPLYLVTFKIFSPSIRRTTEIVNRQFGQLSGNVQEQFSAVSLIKTYAAEDRELSRFKNDNEVHYGHVVRQSRVGHMVGACSEVFVHFGTTIIVAYGGYLAMNGTITAGALTKFLGYVGIMYGPLQRFANLNIVYQNSMSSIRRVFRVFDIKPKITERSGARREQPVYGRVCYEDVKFRYEDNSDESRITLEEDEARPVDHDLHLKPWVINGVNFIADGGARVALVGPSGGGKSTLMSLLPRLYDVGQGRITIDGVDLRDYSLKALRQAIGIVQQDTFVFSGTIRENLCYGRPDATDEQMIASAKAANAHAFITDLADGYNTLLGERGVNLSGGQRQRLSIARALLKNPRILILDEATSALDTESESLVQQALDRLMRGRTCFIIAHRLSTIRNADQILVLQNGKVVEQGKHDQLCKANGMYAKLVHQQFGPLPPADADKGELVEAY